MKLRRALLESNPSGNSQPIPPKFEAVYKMDKRKPTGRNVAELEMVFAEAPEASFCFDIGHARQVDPTMTEACLLLRRFRERLVQLHVSEVSTGSRHDRISYLSTLAFQQVAHLVPGDVPLILETPVEQGEMMSEVEQAGKALPLLQWRAA